MRKPKSLNINYHLVANIQDISRVYPKEVVGMAAKAKSTKTKKTAKTATRTAKKTVSKPAARKAAPSVKSRVSDDKLFFLIDGTTVGSLAELIDAFDRMSDDIFYYHVTPDRNDFANWVNDVLVMPDLAESIRPAQGPLRAEVVILKNLLSW